MTTSVEEVAGRFGLEAELETKKTILSRGGASVAFARSFSGETPEDRHLLTCACLGARLGLDRRTCEYDFDTERGDDSGARNVYELASQYGDRLQQLVPRAALDTAELIGEFDALRRPWLPGAHAELCFVRETARHFHVLADADVDRLPYSTENIIEYARYALFYDAYRFRPHTESRDDFGKTRWFRTTNGQAASRATLFPDFDYDAARSGGAFVLVDRNEFVVVDPTNRRSALARLREVARTMQSDAAQPFSRRVFALSTDGVTVGPTIDGRSEFDASSIIESVVDVTDDQ